MRRRFLSAHLLIPLLALVAAACGGAETTSGAGGSSEAPDAPAESAGTTGVGEAGGGLVHPVTIDHAHGSTTIEARPERVVTVNVQWTDAVLAMGEQPAGFVLSAEAGETDLYPWQVGLLDRSERIDATAGIPYEAIAALEPDLILATHAITDQAQYDTLAAIAPTITRVSGLQVDAWADQVRVLGRVYGDPAAAEAAIAQVEEQIADLALALPGLEGSTYSFANYVAGDGIYVLADSDDGASRMFEDLGMTLDPGIVALDTDIVGRVKISHEQIGLLRADLVGILLNGTPRDEVLGLDRLPAAETGALIEFALADIVGLNTPSPLSVPYLLELMRPSFEIVAG